ncbi:homocysteine S-methyltransferase family protein [Phytohabitans suffuscus]|uniref:Homocysteine S-methyltransferase n=1 Tax=Phytohabitans suffuscus TaxID=624315 RepID=A0A6F8YQS1_9ACTN|nr:homocysteine S-methyltransferase family protein [Phytohabitans suffuscus]BCB88535.1 homocysteine S-methyltransferase [Phytohabitans suffuscus]
MSRADDRPATLRLDGGTATELRRAGIPLNAPWWTTRAVLTDARRRVLRDAHERFLGAGADVVTANTFRCNLRTLRRAGLRDAGLAWMVHAAVGVALAARNAAGTPRTLIAASVAPVEDCYRPDLVPSDDELRAEHAWLATELSRSTVVDLTLVETMNSEREARIALEAALATGGRAWVSFVCDDGARLLSGEPLDRVAKAVEADGAEAVLVNCTGPARTEQCLRALRESCAGPIGAYPNVEDRGGVPRWTHVDGELPASLEPEEFAQLLARWRQDYDLAMVGGCCGATPDHIAALSRLVED